MMLLLLAGSFVFPSSSSLSFVVSAPTPRFSSYLCSSSSSRRDSHSASFREPDVGTCAGLQLNDTVAGGADRWRLDSWISTRIPGISRARVQSSIRSGLVTVNGRVVYKVSQTLREGDKISCTVSKLQPLRAEAEDLPVDVIYEDAHVLVVNKPAHMVVHPAPGNANGTLVNAILHHCRISTPANGRSNTSGTKDEYDDAYEDELDDAGQILGGVMSSESIDALVRPGIVHRLDKGTSGLLVIAKDEHSHAHLAEQFKQHSIHRVYISLTIGTPSPSCGRLEVPIARDSNNRLRMSAVSGANYHRNARYAASRYKVIEEFSSGTSALVEWRLETGRTHQIRAHAKYLGVPLLGDDMYGGTKNMALSLMKPHCPPSLKDQLVHMISSLQRPCLHAISLGFTHPLTKESLRFSCLPPPDFAEVLCTLRAVLAKY